MQFNLKSYQISKTKQYIKKNNFLLFSIGANQNSQNWIAIEQNLHKLKLNYYKTYNNTTVKTLKNSIYKNALNTVNSTFFFLKPQENSNLLTRNSLISTLNSILFTVLAIKLNKKVYVISQSKNIRSFSYRKNVSIMYQFLLTNLKASHSLSKKNQ
jgi:hypothetical protein